MGDLPSSKVWNKIAKTLNPNRKDAKVALMRTARGFLGSWHRLHWGKGCSQAGRRWVATGRGLGVLIRESVVMGTFINLFIFFIF